MHLIGMGFRYVSIQGKERVALPATPFDPGSNILLPQFREAYNRLNPDAGSDEWSHRLKEIDNVLHNDDLGREFYYKYLLEPGRGRIVDFGSEEAFAKNNTFQVATEFTCGNKEGDNFRPDITLFVNGLPLAFIEVKKENNDKGIGAETDRMRDRFRNEEFRRYLNITQIMVFSNDMEYDERLTQGAFYAAIGRRDTCYNPFREEGQTSFPVDEAYRDATETEQKAVLIDNNVPQFFSSTAYRTNFTNHDTPTKRICRSLFSGHRLFFLLKYAISYVEKNDGKLQKHIMRYPQVFATKAIEGKLNNGATNGIVWHTQGSGKTALAYYNVRFLKDYFSRRGIIPQFFFIVDRLDLMQQAQGEFASRGLVVTPVDSRQAFRDIISATATTHNDRGQDEITVVNIQKFMDDSHAVSRHDYNLRVQRIYFIDEAHRGYKPQGCFLSNLVESDPCAIRIALTGTPVIVGDHHSTDIFGDYIHTYYYNASIRDGYTLRLIREDIGANFRTRMQKVIADYQLRAGSLKEGMVFRHESYVQPLLDYIMNDLEQFRVSEGDTTIGGMAVCSSREQAEMMYRLFLEKYADPEELVKEENDDGSVLFRSVGPEVIDAGMGPAKKGSYRAALIIDKAGTRDSRTQWIKLYKEGKVDLLIVFLMLQTGFDAPRLKKIYLHRMPKEQNLLQTLTRVNRPYKDMRFGYVVDFANIEEEYSKTSQDYEDELRQEMEGDNDAYDNSNLLLVSKEEALQRYANAMQVLKDYSLGDPEQFSRELNVEEDREKVRDVLHCLNDVRDLQNMLTSQGDKELIEQLPNLRSLIHAAESRNNLLRLQEGLEDKENVQHILNLALEDIEFEFYKRGEDELTLRDQYRQSIADTRTMFLENYDQDDPAYRTLFEEFMALFRKKDIDTKENFNLHRQVQQLDGIMHRVHRLKMQEDLRAARYEGDRKYARLEKRIEEKEREEKQSGKIPTGFEWSKAKEKLNRVLLAMKHEADDVFFRNQDIINNPDFFARVLMGVVTHCFRDNKVESDHDINVYVANLIKKEYQREYRQV